MLPPNVDVGLGVPYQNIQLTSILFSLPQGQRIEQREIFAVYFPYVGSDWQ